MLLELFSNLRGPFRIYKLISKDNPAQFHLKKAKWAVLIDHYLYMHNICLILVWVKGGGNFLRHPVGGLADSRVRVCCCCL